MFRLSKPKYYKYDRMPFGKYKGEMFSNIPGSYICWLSCKCNFEFNEVFKAEKRLERIKEHHELRSKKHSCRLSNFYDTDEVYEAEFIEQY